MPTIELSNDTTKNEVRALLQHIKEYHFGDGMKYANFQAAADQLALDYAADNDIFFTATGVADTGTVSITSGERTITLSSALAGLEPGKWLKLGGQERVYRIALVVSTTSIVLETNYEGTTLAAADIAEYYATPVAFVSHGYTESTELHGGVNEKDIISTTGDLDDPFDAAAIIITQAPGSVINNNIHLNILSGYCEISGITSNELKFRLTDSISSPAIPNSHLLIATNSITRANPDASSMLSNHDSCGKVIATNSSLLGTTPIDAKATSGVELVNATFDSPDFLKNSWKIGQICEINLTNVTQNILMDTNNVTLLATSADLEAGSVINASNYNVNISYVEGVDNATRGRIGGFTISTGEPGDWDARFINSAINMPIGDKLGANDNWFNAPVADPTTPIRLHLVNARMGLLLKNTNATLDTFQGFCGQRDEINITNANQLSAGCASKFTRILTANTTVATPTILPNVVGMTIEIVLTQDGTGTRTVTWPAIFEVDGANEAGGSATAGEAIYIAFMWTGTVYKQISPAYVWA